MTKGRDLVGELKAAMETKNHRRLGEMVDHLRWQWKLKYQDIYQLAKLATGISEAEWDDLMVEIDEGDRHAGSKD